MTPHRLRWVPALAWSIALAVALALLSAPAASAAQPLDDYAPYQPPSHCSPKPKPGAIELSRWLQRRYRARTTISRPCRRDRDVTSEHQEGRAVDVFLDARTRAGRHSGTALLRRLFARDPAGRPDALARRMGVMYVIWDDHMWPSYEQFRRKPYLSSSCRSRRRCSPTLRHLDHVHLSLSRAGGHGGTSWYERHGP